MGRLTRGLGCDLFLELSHALTLFVEGGPLLDRALGGFGQSLA